MHAMIVIVTRTRIVIRKQYILYYRGFHMENVTGVTVNVVLDSINMAFRDEENILDQIYSDFFRFFFRQ